MDAFPREIETEQLEPEEQQDPGGRTVIDQDPPPFFFFDSELGTAQDDRQQLMRLEQEEAANRTPAEEMHAPWLKPSGPGQAWEEPTRLERVTTELRFEPTQRSDLDPARQGHVRHGVSDIRTEGTIPGIEELISVDTELPTGPRSVVGQKRGKEPARDTLPAPVSSAAQWGSAEISPSFEWQREPSLPAREGRPPALLDDPDSRTVLEPAPRGLTSLSADADEPADDLFQVDLLRDASTPASTVSRQETAPVLAPPAHEPSPPQQLRAGNGAAMIESIQDVEYFGGYALLGQVGIGGMAEVRLACQIGPHGFAKPCVIKRIISELAGDEDLREMMLEEARISNQLAHKNIVRLHDFDRVEGVPYIALELVDGVTLSTLEALAGDRGIPLAIAIQIARDVASALEYAHEKLGGDGRPLHLIHRDVSPQNILISRSGEVKLADFGIARFEGRSLRTAIGPPKGKLRYMSPEQLRYQPIDHRVDIFGLGVVMIELATGKALLPAGCLVVEDLEAHVRRRLAESKTRLPAGYIELLVRMTKADRDQRTASAREVGRLLEAVRETLEDRASLPEYAADVIAPRVPSAEDAIFGLLGPPTELQRDEGREKNGESGASPHARPRIKSTFSSLSISAMDLSQTIQSIDSDGFPTTSHFILSAELGLSGEDRRALSDLAGEALDDTQLGDDNIPDTHLRIPVYPGGHESSIDVGTFRPADAAGRDLSGLAIHPFSTPAAPPLKISAFPRGPVKERRPFDEPPTAPQVHLQTEPPAVSLIPTTSPISPISPIDLDVIPDPEEPQPEGPFERRTWLIFVLLGMALVLGILTAMVLRKALWGQ